MIGMMVICVFIVFFFFQAEDGIRDLVRSRGLGDVYKRQIACFDLVAWSVHRRRARPTCSETKIQKEGVKP